VASETRVGATLALIHVSLLETLKTIFRIPALATGMVTGLRAAPETLLNRATRIRGTGLPATGKRTPSSSKNDEGLGQLAKLVVKVHTCHGPSLTR
jgi:hypothetical protein